MILFSMEEVQHEENYECDTGKQESRRNDCQTACQMQQAQASLVGVETEKTHDCRHLQLQL